MLKAKILYKTVIGRSLSLSRDTGHAVIRLRQCPRKLCKRESVSFANRIRVEGALMQYGAIRGNERQVRTHRP